MAEHPFQLNVGGRLNCLKNCSKPGGIYTQAVHAGVDLEMDGNRLLGSQLFSSIFQQFNVVPIPKGGRQLVLDKVFFFTATEAAQYQDAGGHSISAQGHAFFDVAYSKPFCPLFLQGESTCAGPVSVGIILDYGADFGFRLDVREHGPKIVL